MNQEHTRYDRFRGYWLGLDAGFLIAGLASLIGNTHVFPLIVLGYIPLLILICRYLHRQIKTLTGTSPPSSISLWQPLRQWQFWKWSSLIAALTMLVLLWRGLAISTALGTSLMLIPMYLISEYAQQLIDLWERKVKILK